jgi:hypothetical protein
MQSDDATTIVLSSSTNPKKRAMPDAVLLPEAKKMATLKDLEAATNHAELHHFHCEYCDITVNASTEETPSARSLAREADRLKFKPELSPACKLGFMRSSETIVDRLFTVDTEERHRQYAFQCAVTPDELSRAMALDKITPDEWLTELSTNARLTSSKRS